MACVDAGAMKPLRQPIRCRSMRPGSLEFHVGMSSTRARCRKAKALQLLRCLPVVGDGRLVRRYTSVMAAPTIDELLAAIRQLPINERRALIDRATRDADQDTPHPPPATPPASLLGLMADEPEIVDKMCSLVYDARQTSRMRTLDD